MNIFNEELNTGWPDGERFPYNYGSSKVEEVIQKDLEESKNPLVITGYASLDRILDFLAERHRKLSWNFHAFDTIRILFGNEPYPAKKDVFCSATQFSEDITKYWMERGISIFKCAKVIAAIELIKLAKVDTRIAGEKPIHAKIYQGDNALTIGSSNYTNNGLSHQIEGNVRFRRKNEKNRFNEACNLAERIWELGRDYNDELIALLEALLSKVDWQYALARACVELLEGEWAKKYKQTYYLSDDPQLWPSQVKGIAQAIWVIENLGSVLIADATGSGKTRMGAHLIKAVMNQIWGTGRRRQGSPVLICPPDVVQESWEREFSKCDYSVQTYSKGLLSTPKSTKHNHLMAAIRRCQVLAVDEAHNFFNRTANRTQAIFSNMADYVLLFTATPINRGSQDLLSIIELLGADNFDDELLAIIKPIWNKRSNLNEKMTPQDRDRVRGAIQQFTVRRTKTILNRMVDEESERYKDAFGKLCRYPKHKSQSYPCDGTDNDRAIAKRIREATESLLGLVYLKEISELPEYLRKQGITEEKYLELRLKSAKLLAAYNVMACLRSSRASLLEHIYGTNYAKEYFKIPSEIKAKETGNLIKSLGNLAGKTLKNKLGIELPDWLSEPDKHKQACQEEIEIYKTIGALTKEISASREQAKSGKLLELLGSHNLVIAFDDRLITLHDIKFRLEQSLCCKVIIATGDNDTDRKHLNDLFKLGSQASGIIALCSDAMSEGVNLQQASVVVQLTMPSVIRLAEQRIGRVDRMDSPHSEIEVWWPKDSDEFALRASENKFLRRHDLTSDLFGSNLPLPEDISSEIATDLSDRVITSERDLAKSEEETKISRIWELGDVFDPVRSLVEGDRPLVPHEIYNQLRRNKVGLRFSLVKAKYPWAFFAIAGTTWGAPRWVYLDLRGEDKPITDLEQISHRLREHLVDPVEDLLLGEASESYLQYFLKKMILSEKYLLPRKKQRALNLMEKVLTEYRNKAVQNGDSKREVLTNALLSFFENEPEIGKHQVDFSLLAESWLDMIRPLWFERLKESGRSEPLLLKDMYEDLINNQLETEKLELLLNVETIKPLDERLVAAIIGI